MNPRSFVNDEPMEYFGFDIHVGKDLWDEFVEDENPGWRYSRARWIAVGLLLRSEAGKTLPKRQSHDTN